MPKVVLLESSADRQPNDVNRLKLSVGFVVSGELAQSGSGLEPATSGPQVRLCLTPHNTKVSVRPSLTY